MPSSALRKGAQGRPKWASYQRCTRAWLQASTVMPLPATSASTSRCTRASCAAERSEGSCQKRS